MPKLAKCGIHSKCFCDTKHDASQCAECILVKHHGKLYKFINGVKYKKCPRCGEYKPLLDFHISSNTSGRKYRSWCKSCMREYCRKYASDNRQHYMIGHKVNGAKTFVRVDSATKMLKYVRKYLVEDNETIVEIKRL